MKNIIINGRVCSGKDSVADYLVKKYGFVKVSFAEPVHWIAANIFKMKNKNRRLLQFIGETGRFFYKDIWVKITFRKVRELNEKGFNVVISDCRRENEYLKAQEYGFLPIRVSADYDIRVKRAIKRDNTNPYTYLWENDVETGADDFFYHEITNNGTKTELYQQIEKILSENGIVKTTLQE